MSTTVDQRVVSMKFDNKQFESGVSTSLSTLDRLKNGLNLEGASKGLEGIGAAAKNVSMDGIASGVEAVKIKFSALQVVAITALANITNSAMTAGKNLVKSFTLDPIKDGFKEYETQMGAIQTVMANTSSKGTTLKQVNEALNELNTYSDKTIYNFTEMAKNIGTFTAAGVDLNTSVSAIKGIANLAAVSGSNSEQASTAMYQLSQAMASGTVKLMDWNSVVNAGMGGEIFQKALTQTAKVHGINIDAMIKKEGSFRETLHTGWLTTKVLTETLSKFTGDLTAGQLKAMGYNKEQVAGILKMGVMAYEAATKVKTLTQLMQTLKEAAGSGWAQTWAIIAGDFEEAKKMFTDVSNVLGNIIGASAKARNDVLKGWKDLGGRTVLIDAIRIAFNNVMDVIKSVTSAFKEVFPPTTAKQLMGLTTGLKDFITSLTVSKSGLMNIHNTFKGLFAVLDIGWQIIGFVAKALFLIVDALFPITGGVNTITGSFGGFLVMIDNVIRYSNIFGIALKGIGAIMGVVKTVITVAMNGIAFVFAGADSLLKPYVDTIKNFVKTSTLMEDVTNSIKSAFITAGNALLPYVEQLKTFIKTSTLVEDVTDRVKQTFNDAGNALLPYVEAIDNFIKTSTLFEDIMTNITSVFTNFIPSVQNLISNLKGLDFNGVSGASDKLNASLVFLSSTGTNVKDSFSGAGDSMTKIKNVLEEVGGSIKRIFGPAVTFLIDKLKGLTLSDVGMALAGGGIFLFVKQVIKSLKSVNEVASGFSKVVEGITGSLEAFQKKLKADAILKIAIAIGILTLSVVALSMIPTEALYKALGALSVICIELSLGMMVLQKASVASPGLSTKLIALGIAIIFIASAVKKLSDIDSGKMQTGVQGLAAILTTLAIFIKVTSGTGGIQTSIVGVVGIALAVLILCDAVTKFGNIDPKIMDKGIQGIVSALLVLAIFIKTIGNPEHMVAVGVGLTLMSVALTIFAAAIGLYALIPIPVLAKGMIAIAIALTILAIAGKAMSDPGVLAGAAAILVLAIAVNVLVPAIVILGLLPIAVIGVALLALAGVFLILGLSAVILAPLAPVILTLAASIGIIGVGVFLLGGGLILFSAGLAALAISGAAFIASFIAGSMAILNLIPVIAKLVGTAVIAIATAISTAMPSVVGAVIAIANGLITAFNALIVPVVQASVLFLLALLVEIAKYILPMTTAGLQLVIGFVNALINNMPQIVATAVRFMLSFLSTINGQIPSIINAAIGIVLNFVSAISSKLPIIIDSAFRLIITFINGLANAVRNNSYAITSACRNLITAMVDALSSMNYMLLDVGINIIRGMINGVKSMGYSLYKAAKSVVSDAVNGVKNFLGIQSPSKVFAEIGKYSGQGLINGLVSMSSKVSNSATDIGKGAVNAMSKAILGISDIVNTNIDSNPTIRPVMDLSDIQNGSKQLYSMMNGINGYAIAGSVNLANNTARSMQNSSQPSDPLGGLKDTFKGMFDNLTIPAPQNNFNGQYSFAGKEDIDYFMNQAALLIQRRKS